MSLGSESFPFLLAQFFRNMAKQPRVEPSITTPRPIYRARHNSPRAFIMHKDGKHWGRGGALEGGWYARVRVGWWNATTGQYWKPLSSNMRKSALRKAIGSKYGLRVVRLSQA